MSKRGEGECCVVLISCGKVKKERKERRKQKKRRSRGTDDNLVGRLFL